MIIEPSLQGNRFFHYPPDGASDLELFLRCVSCRKAKLAKDFAPYPNVSGRPPTLTAVCFMCRRLRFGGRLESHPLYTPELGAYFSRLEGSVASEARARSILFLIDRNDMLDRYLANDGRCEVTGVVLRPFDKGRAEKASVAPSVDRIDSFKGYTPDNIQIVAVRVNLMKGDMTMDQFVTWCRRVAEVAHLKSEKFASEFEAMERSETQPDDTSQQKHAQKVGPPMRGAS